MAGGFSWSNLGNSISSGFRNFGSFVSNTASKIGSSQGFQQAKQGFLKSGILENAGSLAGTTLNALTDIGRLKLEQELMKLREKALGTAVPSDAGANITQEQLAQLIASMNNNPLPAPSAPVPIPTTLPAYPMFPTANQDYGVALGPVNPPPQARRPVPAPGERPRKRKRVSGWGMALDDLLGSGVSHKASRHCY